MERLRIKDGIKQLQNATLSHRHQLLVSLFGLTPLFPIGQIKSKLRRRRSVKKRQLRLSLVIPPALAGGGSVIWRLKRWSRNFGPVVKVDRLMKEVIRNDEEKEPRARVQGQGCA